MLDQLRRSAVGRTLRNSTPFWLKRPLAKLLARLEARGDPFRLSLRDVDRRLLEASSRETQSWQHVETLEEWETFIEPRIKALRASLGDIERSTGTLAVHRSGRIDGDGFAIENLAFEGRPQSIIGANLYRPSTISTASPGILICHSHHNPKTQVELQEAGIEWARAGCVVLVPDLPGHGERRDHPFGGAQDWRDPFRVDRQDYWFRYVLAIQLRLVGHSLMGWMVRDAMRCVDVLLAREDVDPEKILILGCVAGGGDVAAVTAALDRRIRAAVPFGFGGAQRSGKGLRGAAPESNFAGSGSWEETRNLPLSARDGFLPWAIVASIAPRHLIYAHEFGWEENRDPTWPRLRRVYELHGVPERLAVIHGQGTVSGPAPRNTHCNNVGSIHRQQLAPWLELWFGVKAPKTAGSAALDPARLACLDHDVRDRLDVRPIHRIAGEVAAAGIARARLARVGLSSAEVRVQLQQELGVRLGEIESRTSPGPRLRRRRWGSPGLAVAEEIVLGSVPEAVRLQLFVPSVNAGTACPVVVKIRQAGFDRSNRRSRCWIGRLMIKGKAVCLVTTRGMGHVRQDETGYGRMSFATRVSASEWMLGRTLLATKLSDLRTCLGYLATRRDLDAERIAVWGDCDTLPDPTGEDGARPMNAEPSPIIASPMGAVLALLVALYENNIRAVYVRGGLCSLASIAESPFCLVPHEAIIPGMLAIGDLSDVAAALAPIPLRMEALVDARNRVVDLSRLEAIYRPTIDAYRAADASANLLLAARRATDDEAAEWLEKALEGEPEGQHPRGPSCFLG